jgi:hypothetical protein
MDPVSTFLPFGDQDRKGGFATLPKWTIIG